MKPSMPGMRKGSPRTLFLEVNPWSASKGGDVYPLMNPSRKEEHLKDKGFRLVHKVMRRVYSLETDQMPETCVIKIFERLRFKQG